MRVQFSSSFDFNQMLVFSVFVHLLILTAVLFLPKPVLPEKAIVPAFMVNLVSETAGFKSAGPKRSAPPKKAKKSTSKKPTIAKKTEVAKKLTIAKKKTKPMKSIASKPVREAPKVITPKSSGILDALSKLEGKMVLATPPGKKMVEELDQLARLETPTEKPLSVKPLKKKIVTEETFRELETLKNKKIEKPQSVVPTPLHKEILQDFDALKMEKSFPEVSTEETTRKVQKPSSEKEKPEIIGASKVNLLKELEQLAKLDITSGLASEAEKEEPEQVEETQGNGESYDALIEKFESLSVDSEPVRVEISSAKLKSSSFQSKLRTLPKTTRTPSQSGSGDSYVHSDKEGPAGADAQALYVGLIQEKVYRNWREPLAEKHNQEVVVSFFIFPGGNIDKPLVKKSSGVETLDTLAISAVLDSVPFSEFPKELKMSNLHINIHFKYVPKDE